MAKNRSQTRQRLIDAALELFSEQGFAATTTRQIAEQAQVNEVTLFRNFGSKQGLLLAVIGEAGIFKNLQASLANSVQDAAELSQALKTYARDRLRAIDTIPELLRSVVGEAAHYSETDRRQLGMGIHTATQALAQVLAGYMADQRKASVTPMQLASLLNSLLFGYMVLELTTEFHDLWPDRETFLEYVGVLCTPEPGASNTDTPASITAATSFAVPTQADLATSETEIVNDLAAAQVHELLQRAKKLDLQTYAIVYVLFAAGLTPTE
ncbi:MAG: helix-turn-helix domain-containing protein, partial [Cyanobacteria bacterium P01_H01_bin.121]